jgi:hypothetical protein
MSAVFSQDSLSHYRYDPSSTSPYAVDDSQGHRRELSEAEFNQALGQAGFSVTALSGQLYDSDYQTTVSRAALKSATDTEASHPPILGGAGDVGAEDAVGTTARLEWIGYTDLLSMGVDDGPDLDTLVFMVMFEMAKNDVNINFKLNNALQQAQLTLKQISIDMKKDKIDANIEEAKTRFQHTMIGAAATLGLAFAGGFTTAKAAPGASGAWKQGTGLALSASASGIGGIVGDSAASMRLWHDTPGGGASLKAAQLEVDISEVEREETALSQTADAVSSGQNEAREQMKKLVQLVADLMQLNTQAVNMIR